MYCTYLKLKHLLPKIFPSQVRSSTYDKLEKKKKGFVFPLKAKLFGLVSNPPHALFEVKTSTFRGLNCGCG